MPIVAICSAVHCGGEEVARGASEELGYQLVGDELLAEAARAAGFSTRKLYRALTGNPSFFRNVIHDRERSVVHLKAALARLLNTDDVVYRGMAVHLIPERIGHVLKVCLVAEHAHRVAVAQRAGLSARAANKEIETADLELGQFTQDMVSHGAWDASLYDLKIPMHETSVAEAVQLVCDAARRDALRPSTRSIQAALDFQLAARVNVRLLDEGHYYCDAAAEDGVVTVIINKEVMRLEKLQKELETLVGTFEGVEEVRTRVGPKFNQPNILREFDFEVPSKVLLVDDEREFVMTLSERLKMRDIESDVVYNGFQALSYVETDQPDVMVLDLRMPGMDGLEVLKKVTKTNPEMKVIILTAHGSEADELAAREMGAFAYLRKPVNIDVLARVMREASTALDKERAAAAEFSAAGAGSGDPAEE